MTRISTLIAVLATGAAFGAPLGAHAGNQFSAAPVILAANASALAEGEVRRVDKGSGTVTLKHGPIPSIDMPPMTMGYRAKDKAMLEQLKAGDKIKFEAGNVGGVYTLIRFEKMK